MLYVSSLPQVRDFAQQEAFRIDSSSLIPFIEKELFHIDLLNSFVPQMQKMARSLGYELDDRKIGYYSSYFPIT